MLLFCSQYSKAQDPVFSQFYNAPIQLNPGLVGLKTTPRIAINYRNQWPNWPQVYATYAASYDQFFEYLNSGFGGQIIVDDAGQGVLKTSRVTGVYAYRLRMNRNLQARVGLEVGFINTRLNWDKLFFYDQLVAGEVNGTPGGILLPSSEVRPDNLNVTSMDLSMGAVLFSEKYYFGISIKHLNGPELKFNDVDNVSYSGLPPRLILHAGMQIDLDGYNKEGFGSFIAPSILYTRQSGLNQLNAGVLYNREQVFGGVWIRHTLTNLDAAIISAGWRTNWLKLSYSFDLTLSDAFVSRTVGSHEIGIVINVGDLANRSSRYEDCFSIFR